MTQTFTVGELCTALGAAVGAAFPDEVWVTGAISSLTRSGNGHVYFDLVDPVNDLGSVSTGVLPVILFSTDRQRVNLILKRTGTVRMTDGVEIRIRGRVAFYPPQGRVQLRMSLIDPAYTMGQMAAARQALLDQLAAEGLLNANKGREVPVPPLRVALVTSVGSAAHADFVHELALSGYPFEVLLVDCRVQGIDAVPSLADGITRAGLSPGVDVVAVVRGGGARTDLAAYDHERVARAVAACPRPVVVGVGHEIDRSVADEVAHTSAKTPTAAAATLVDAVRDFDHTVEHAAARLVTLAAARLDGAAGWLAASGNRLVAASNGLLAAHDARLGRQATQLAFLAHRALDRAEAAVDRADHQVRLLDPAALLARGWSITHTASGALVRHPDDAPPGTEVVTTVAGGRLTATVSSAAPSPAPAGGPAGRPADPAEHPGPDRPANP